MCPITIAALAIATVATGASIYQGQQAAHAQGHALDLQRQQQDLQAARQKRDTIKAARIAYANSSQAAENQGMSMSSVSQGSLGAIQSQVTSNLSFLDQYQNLGDQASVSLGAANRYQASSRLWGDVASFAGQAAGKSDLIRQDYTKVQKVFGNG